MINSVSEQLALSYTAFHRVLTHYCRTWRLQLDLHSSVFIHDESCPILGSEGSFGVLYYLVKLHNIIISHTTQCTRNGSRQSNSYSMQNVRSVSLNDTIRHHVLLLLSIMELSYRNNILRSMWHENGHCFRSNLFFLLTDEHILSRTTGYKFCISLCVILSRCG